MELSAHKIFLVFFLLAGVLKRQVSRKYEPGKNIKICNITGIVPTATDYSLQIKNAPWRKEKISGRFCDGKNYEAQIFENLQLDGVGGVMPCL